MIVSGWGGRCCTQRNKRLILASISGFGQTGPYSSRGGFDLITQAMSGLMSTNGPADGPPHRLPIAISDVTAGMFLAFGILAAVEARHRTGEGQHVETSLLEAATSLAVYESGALLRHRHASRTDRSGASRQFAVSVLPDRGWLHHRGASQQKFFVQFCDLVGAPELVADPRFASNAERVKHNDALVALLAEKLRATPSAHWLAALERLGIPAGPVLHYDEVYTDPQILARDMVVETIHPVTGPFRTMGVTVKLSATPGSVRRPAPRLGEHTSEILNERKAAE